MKAVCLLCCRAQPIDVLTANLHLAEEFDVSADEPYKAFTGLSLQSVQELHAAVSSMQVSCQLYNFKVQPAGCTWENVKLPMSL